jgi:G3E family GTPase
MPLPKLVILGGFLGSGKTTTLIRLARDLVASGKRVGIITNDQGKELVDTELFRASGFATRDVRGGCFCCRLDEFLRETEVLTTTLELDVLLAEPVGSCTDLVATVVRPLQQLFDGFDIAPFTVIVDATRALDALSPRGRASLPEKVTYIYRLQQMEAQAIAVNKIDTLECQRRSEIVSLLRAQFPERPVFEYSARSGQGFDQLSAWLLSRSADVSDHALAIDYETYEQGEAHLAWLDARYTLSSPTSWSVDSTVMSIADALRITLSDASLDIAHVKLLLRAGNLTSAVSIARPNAHAEFLQRAGEHATSANAELLVNARVVGSPDELRSTAERSIVDWSNRAGMSVHAASATAFSPPRPLPTYRVTCT